MGSWVGAGPQKDGLMNPAAPPPPSTVTTPIVMMGPPRRSDAEAGSFQRRQCVHAGSAVPPPRGDGGSCARDPGASPGFPPHLGVRLWPLPRLRSRHARGPVAPASRHELDGAFVFP